MQRALQRESVLVEIARFGVFNFHHGKEASWWGPARYAAWVFPPQGMGEVQLVDLGPAEAIERAVSEYRKAMRNSAEEINRRGEAEAEAELRKVLVALSERVLRPLEPVLAKFSNWQISPDAALWLVPWGALPLADGSYALEKHTINYLISGRDLVAPPTGVQPKTGSALVVADPDFDLAAVPAVPVVKGEAAAVDQSLRHRTGAVVTGLRRARSPRTGRVCPEHSKRRRRSCRASRGFWDPSRSCSPGCKPRRRG